LSDEVASAENGDDDGQSPDATVEAASLFIAEQQERHSHMRGPWLAEMELRKRLLDRKSSEQDEDRLLELICSYFVRFCRKLVCVDDLKRYISALSPAKRKEFGQRLQRPPEPPASLDDAADATAIAMLERFSGAHTDLDGDDLRSKAEHLQRLYFSCREMVIKVSNLSPKASEPPPTELRQSDLFLVVAAHIYWKLWVDESRDEDFWRAVAPLEYGLALNPSNRHIRFVLIKFYERAGAVACAEKAYLPMELKHIQLDSLGHLLWRFLFCQGHFKRASSFCGHSLKFFASNAKETLDHIVSGYRYGSFGKIREFIHFRERVARSANFLTLTNERILSDLLAETAAHEQTVKAVSYLDIDPAEDAVEWDKLMDNRDFCAMIFFEPIEDRYTQDLAAESFRSETCLLRLRTLTVRAIVAAVHLSEEETGDAQARKTIAETLSRLVADLDEACHAAEVESARVDTAKYSYPMQVSEA